ncbi:carboxylate--amine ligase [Halobium salinum]|uniref:Carboxylate--amine ligase n=1 Tax=Halobium salinum TaxID=1364940 RepID=A0ABD5P9S9_9EURY|nr:carboxylate--amine ligase [Halobium salinum]
MDGEPGSEDTVLIPTGYDPASYPCVRSLGSRGVRTLLASEFDDVPASASRFCDEVTRVPAPGDDLLAYKDALVGLAARPDVRTVVPIRPADTYVLSKFREEFERYVTLVVPEMETMRTVHDRVRLAAACEEAGVPVPRTRRLGEMDDWSGQHIIKSRYNILVDEYMPEYEPGENRVVKDVTHVRQGDTPDTDELVERMGHEPIVQEFIPIEDEYMFAGLYDHGEPVATFQHKQIRGNSYTGGGGVYRKSMYDQEMEDVARKLLSHLDYHGIACIEYMKHAETGEYVLTEINPRMWQSLPSTVRAGADFPHYYWQLATGQKDRIEPGYELGVGSHLLYGEVGHLLSVLTDDSDLVERPSFVRRAWEIAASCYDEPKFDILRFDDPAPFLRGVAHMLPDGEDLRGKLPFLGGRRRPGDDDGPELGDGSEGASATVTVEADSDAAVDGTVPGQSDESPTESVTSDD